ncbi:hypothetical protein Cob_v003889 [Colletotrichum orbiculare MAFF 240422]|uniref:Uncharacterized protein n=1 Tax=Colletotrichum orbiculare (strain 104-T / ATCC 96160 / CBS 514.97 / LARS 414 / MAFF 240422) TaxID=1213857 RepID=A0A484G192_COLOR|nr:hypothetical protein Cob_v003889 [Colletotrichum orbiculare MAFF 240422]
MPGLIIALHRTFNRQASSATPFTAHLPWCSLGLSLVFLPWPGPSTALPCPALLCSIAPATAMGRSMQKRK